MSDKYMRIKNLGAGTSGVVWLVDAKDNGQKYVLKEVDMEKFDAKDVQHAMSEVSVLAALDHPNIVHHRESFVEDNKLYIAMEFADGGDLESAIKEQRKIGEYFEEDKILDWFTQICLALKYVHDMKILHRDLKTQNIFLMHSGAVKLGDFGLTSVLANTLAQAETRLGTPYYMSPELCQGIPYTSKNDVWGLGCILYKLCSLRHAFNAKTLKSLIQAICTKKTPKVPSKYSRDMQKLVSAMLQKDPNERPTIDQLLKVSIIRRRAKSLLAAGLYTSDHARNVILRELKRDHGDGTDSNFSLPESSDEGEEHGDVEGALAALAKKHLELGGGEAAIVIPDAGKKKKKKDKKEKHKEKEKEKEKERPREGEDDKKKKKKRLLEEHDAGLEDLREQYLRVRREKEAADAAAARA